MASRLAILERNHVPAPGANSINSTIIQRDGDESTMGSDGDISTMTSLRLMSNSAREGSNWDNKSFAHSFDDDLRQSRVYARATHRFSNSSLPSAANRSMGWSFFSDMSLSDISDLSVIALPIFSQELWNSQHYVSIDSKLIAMAQNTTDTMSTNGTELRWSDNDENKVSPRVGSSETPLKLLISKPMMVKNSLGWDPVDHSGNKQVENTSVNDFQTLGAVVLPTCNAHLDMEPIARNKDRTSENVLLEVCSPPHFVPPRQLSTGDLDYQEPIIKNKEATFEHFSLEVISPPQFIPPSPVLAASSGGQTSGYF